MTGQGRPARRGPLHRLNLSAAEDQLSAGFDQKDPDIDSDGYEVDAA